MAKITREKGALETKKAAPPVKEPGYRLPTKKTTPVANLLGYILLLFGEKKIGKTTMLAEGGEDTFFAFFEPGGKSLSLYADVFVNWAHFKAAVAQIISEQPRRFNHVVIDTVDLAYKVSERYTYKKLGIDHASDEAYGKGWAAIRENFSEPIMRLVNSGVAVTFVSHADEREITRLDGRKYDKIAPTMPKQARELVEGLVDIWAYYGYDGDRRILAIQGDDHVAAGHRLTKHFRHPDGTPIRHIDMGSSPSEAFQNFNDAFHNRYVKRSPAKEEQPAARTFVKKKLTK